MTAAAWATCGDPGAMLRHLEEGAIRRVGLNRARSQAGRMARFRTLAQAEARKRRLLAAACCRRLWHLLLDERHRRAVEAAERYADGLATEQELASAHQAATAARQEINGGRSDLHAAAEAAREATAAEAIRLLDPCPYAYNVSGGDETATLLEEFAQASLVRCVFGNPFRPKPAVEPAWLAWNGGIVASIAGRIYDERQLPAGTLDADRLAVLADALEDAGATDADLLAHLRSQGPHVRGCFALDSLLGRR